jgi:hypothetical protein
MMPVNWSEKVVSDYHSRIIVDADNPILAFKANRNRYTNLSNQLKYAGLPYPESSESEDAMTWNVFRSLQKGSGLNRVSNLLGIGEAQGLLLWTLLLRQRPSVPRFNTESENLFEDSLEFSRGK